MIFDNKFRRRQKKNIFFILINRSCHLFFKFTNTKILKTKIYERFTHTNKKGAFFKEKYQNICMNVPLYSQISLRILFPRKTTSLDLHLNNTE